MFSLEVNSDSPKNFVNLRENHRKAITLRFKEARYVYEGEVVEVTETKSYKKKFPWFRKQKSASSWVIGLKTAEETKEYKFTPSDATFSANVVVGDVVHIQAVSGEMTRLGRCSDSFGSETVFDEQEYLPLPKGKVYKKKVIVTQEVTLHDLDVAIAHKQRHDGIYGLVQQKALLNEEINTPYDFRKRIDEAVISLIDDGELELVPGLLYITEGHKLDIECFSYLSRVLKTILCPLVILATDRGICYRANSRTHGIPVYLLKHMIIIQTCPNYKSACIIQEILKLSGKWSVASIDKRIESIKLQWNVNAAGLTACLVGATVTVLDGNSKTISFLIQLLGFLCFFISVYHYNCSLLLLNEYLPRAKVNKNEVKISIPTEIEIAHHSRAGVLSGSIGLYCVGLAIATIAWIRFSNRVADTLVLLIPLVLFMLSAPFLLFWAHRSYMRFVSKRITQRRPKEIKRV